MKLLIADPHGVTRLGLKALFNGSKVFKTIKEASTTKEVMREVKAGVDLVLLDTHLEMAGEGLNCLNRIILDYPEQNVLFYSGYENPTYVARAVALGAKGFIHKMDDPKVLLQKCEMLAKNGEPLWTREEMRRVTGALATPRMGVENEVSLTKRENEVLKQMQFGLSNKEIAAALGISYETVKEHVQHILRKIGVSDRTQAALWALRLELTTEWKKAG